MFRQRFILVAMLIAPMLSVNVQADQVSCSATYYCFENISPGGVEGFPRLGGRVDVSVIHREEKTVATLVKRALICEWTKSESAHSYRMCIETDERTRKSIQRNADQHAVFSIALVEAGSELPDTQTSNRNADVEAGEKLR